MTNRCLLLIILNILFVILLPAQTETWFLTRTDSVGGWPTTSLTELPIIVETPYSDAALFDGINDGFLVNCNPLGSATSFTIEVFFRPDSNAANNEQRFIHIRNLANDTRRVLLETRLLVNQRWILDTFIKSESSNLTLVDSSRTYTTGEWHHVALTYTNGIMRQYVDTVELMSGSVTYLPIATNGKTSIGARQDPRSWFKGAIRMVRISKRALSPSEFLIPTVNDSSTQSSILSISAGWNLISVPLIQTNDSATVVFPGKYGAMFGYDQILGDYTEAPILTSGEGFWVYYTDATTVTINGTVPDSIIITCKAGWNLIGSRETEIQVSELRLSTGSIYGSAFRYDTGIGDYMETTVIPPGQGIWLYVTEDCELTIP